MGFNKVEKPLVFVLGAGAHIPFGFPSGAGLREHMLLRSHGMYPLRPSPTQLAGKDMLDSLLAHDQALGKSHIAERHEAFRKAFLWSLLPSIDDFLQRRNEHFGKWGRRLIVHLMLLYEQSALSRFETSGFDWFGTLWAHINCPASELPNQNIAFVTFNYDRTIEHLLCMAAANADGISPQQAWKYASKIPVIHLHGAIGKYLPPESQAEKGGYEYGQKRGIQEAFLDELEVGLRLYWEDSSRDSQDWSHARAYVRDAAGIYVLGIGSAVEPLTALFRGVVDSKLAQRMTVTGLREAEIDRLVGATGYHHISRQQLDPTYTALDLLRTHFSTSLLTKK